MKFMTPSNQFSVGSLRVLWAGVNNRFGIYFWHKNSVKGTDPYHIGSAYKCYKCVLEFERFAKDLAEDGLSLR